MIRFSQNILKEIRPRAMTRDIDWGIAVPLDGWRDNPTKKLYVWFDAVIGYLSASIEYSPLRRPRRVARLVERPGSAVVLLHGQGQHHVHSQTPAGRAAGVLRAGARAASRGVRRAQPAHRGGVVGVPDHGGPEVLLVEAGRDPASATCSAATSPTRSRYFVAAAGPENQDSDFTWAEFVRRTNDELVAGWGTR